MTRPILLALSVAFVAFWLAAAPARAGKEEKVKLEDCPKAVQDTLKKAAVGGKITEIEKETKGDKVVYEADVVIEDEEFEVKVAEDGKLLSKKAENEDEDDDD